MLTALATIIISVTVSAIISVIVSFQAIDFLLRDATRKVDEYYSRYTKK